MFTEVKVKMYIYTAFQREILYVLLDLFQFLNFEDRDFTYKTYEQLMKYE